MGEMPYKPWEFPDSHDVWTYPPTGAADPIDPMDHTLIDDLITTYPSNVLVCQECETYHECNDDWNNCPHCGEELLRVAKA